MANGLSHVRIDEGVKRGPRRKPRNARSDKGRMLPILAPNKRLEAVTMAAGRIANGEYLATIAADIGVTEQCIGMWLLDEHPEQYQLAQRRGLISRIIQADKEIDDARDPLSLARAREKAKFARWDAERRLSRMFGMKQQIEHTVSEDWADKLRRAKERTGNVVDVEPVRSLEETNAVQHPVLAPQEPKQE